MFRSLLVGSIIKLEDESMKIREKSIRLGSLSKLVILSVCVYTIVLVVNALIVNFADTGFSILISDQLVFYNRGLGVLRGEVPYRDFYTHAAPLSPYLWFFIVIISMLLSGDFSTTALQLDTYLDSAGMVLSSYVFRVFFAFCLISSAIILYKLLELKGYQKSFWIALIYSINPYFLYLTSFWGSDECIIPLLILLPIYLLEKKKYYLASVSLIIGTGLKYFPILIVPLILIYNKRVRHILIQLSITTIGIVACYLPFYFLDSEAFLAQFNYPLDNARNQGLAAFHEHFSSSNFSPLDSYEYLTITVVLIGLFSLVLFLTRDNWSFEKTLSILILFLLLFPKIQFSYFVLIFPFLMVMIFKRNYFSVVYALTFLCSMMGGVTADYILSYEGTNIFSYISAWIITIILYLSMIVILIHVFLTKEFSTISQDKKLK